MQGEPWLAKLFLNEEAAARLSPPPGFQTPWEVRRDAIPLTVALVGSGMPLPRVLALVGCGKQKRITSDPVEAKDLYVGRLFRAAYDWAKEYAEDVLILSALHALVQPNQKLMPYDFSMTQMFESDRLIWGRSIIHSLKHLYPLTPLRIVLLAGGQYVRPLTQALEESTAGELSYWTIEDPLKGFDMFQRLKWFKETHALP